MKKVLSFLLLAFALVLMLEGCKKKESKTEEEETATESYTYDPELQSAKDISFANYVISDLDMMCGFVGESTFTNIFYAQVPGTSTITIIKDVSAEWLSFSFNQTNCLDGYLRDGTFFMNYNYDAVSNPSANPQSNNYRDFGFAAKLNFSEYKVNGWKIELYDFAKPAHIVNKISSPAYDPSLINLSWEISGKFRFLHPTSPSRELVWEGTLVKTLTNTNDPAVFAPDKLSAINWNLAKVHYTGTVTGFVLGNRPFSSSITNSNPVKRDFTCAAIVSGSTAVTQYHPFISGVTTATISTYHPRSINYGPQQACDNNGSISFSSETHTVTFD